VTRDQLRLAQRAVEAYEAAEERLERLDRFARGTSVPVQVALDGTRSFTVAMPVAWLREALRAEAAVAAVEASGFGVELGAAPARLLMVADDDA
jgi:ribosomal protein L11